MDWNELKNPNCIKWTGIVLLLVALTILGISLLGIKSNEIMLNTQTLGEEEVWAYEGSLHWWQNSFNKTILPTVTLLTTTGILTLFTSQILPYLQEIKQENPILTMFEKQTVSTTNHAIRTNTNSPENERKQAYVKEKELKNCNHKRKYFNKKTIRLKIKKMQKTRRYPPK